MQLGFVSAILPDLSLEAVFSTAHDLGYDCVEVMCWPVGKAERRYAGITHIDVNHLDTTQAKQINDLAWKYGVNISALGYYPNPLSPDANESRTAAEHIRKVIDACAVLAIPRMTTFVGRDWHRSVEENFELFRDTWQPIINFAEDRDVRIGIENCPMLFTNDEWPGGKNLAISPAIWRRMFTEIPSTNFGLNYDPSHLVWQQMDYLKPIREFSDRLVHVHAKDVRMHADQLDDVGILATPLQYHSPCLPGRGEVDWPRFFSTLEDVGYQGPVCVEVEDRDYEDSLESRCRALQESCTTLRDFVK